MDTQSLGFIVCLSLVNVFTELYTKAGKTLMVKLKKIDTIESSTTGALMKVFVSQLVAAVFFAACIFVPFYLWSM